MKLRSDTAAIQHRLGEFCRTGKADAIPGTVTRRLKHYRRLVKNGVMNTLTQAYPITVAALPDEPWEEMVDSFFINHDPASAQLWKLPEEFYHYHVSSGTSDRLQLPWLNDLLLFEWTEIEVHTMPDMALPDIVTNGSYLHDAMALNPEFQLLQLEYPVHKAALREATSRKGDYFVLVCREPDSGTVQFLDLSLVHAFILMRMQETGLPLQELKGEIHKIAEVERETYLDRFLVQFARDLFDKQVILGFQPAG